MIYDDSDVKIFNDEKKDSFDEVSIIAEMTKNRRICIDLFQNS